MNFSILEIYHLGEIIIGIIEENIMLSGRKAKMNVFHLAKRENEKNQKD
jgi:hypothetical protein